MKYNELIERYVYAVVRQLPWKQRKDIEQELTSLINDMLEERCGDITPTERDVNVVLAELGKPSELAAKYDPEGERSLIGPRYFRRYIQTMKIVLPSVAGALVLAAAISLIFEGTDKSWFLTIAEWLGNIVSAVFCSAAMVTLCFAIFEYKKVSLDEDDLSKLPAVPENSRLIQKSDCIVGIVFSVIVMVLFLFVPQFISYFGVDDKGVTTFVPMFNADVMRSVWFCWVAVFMLSIAREAFGLLEGVYTLRYAIVSAVINVLSAAGVVFALTREGIMAPECISHVSKVFEGEPDALVSIFSNFNIFLLCIWCLALLGDTAKAFIKCIRGGKES